MQTNHVISLLLAIAAFSVTGYSHAQIYKHVDEDGYVTYSDKPVKGTTTPHKPEPITTIKGDNKPHSKAKKTTVGEEDEEDGKRFRAPKSKPEIPSYEVSISSPSDGEVVRANGGQIVVQLAVTPALNTDNSHRIVVKLNSQTRESQDTTVTFTDISRGPHTVSASIVDAKGQLLKQSSPIGIHVLRHSAKRRAN